MRFEHELSGPSEVFAPGGGVFPRYRQVLEEMERMGPEEWERRVRRAHERLLEEQLELGISGEDKTNPASCPRRTGRGWSAGSPSGCSR